MAIRLTGMNSGLDTESIITQLVSAKSVKKNSLVKAQTRLSWKMDAWKSLNSKIYSLYTNTIGKMRFSDAYTMKKTSVSNPNVASVVASANATNGVQTLKVNSLAKSGYLTGESLKDEAGKKTNYKSSTKLSDIAGMDIAEGEKVSLTLKTGDKETAIDLTGDSTIGDLVKQLKSAGVNATFDENYQRFFISSTTTGKDADFSLTADNMSGFSALSALGINVMDDLTKAEYTSLANMTTEEKDAYIQKKVEEFSAKEKKSIETANKTIEDNEKKIEKFWESMDDPAFVRAELDTSEKIADVKGRYEALRDSLKEAPEDESEDDKKERQAKLKDAEAAIKKLDTLAGYTKNVDKAKESIAVSEDRLKDDSAKIREEVTADLDSRIQTAKDALAKGADAFSKDATRIKGKDAEIELNGAVFDSGSNTFNINGLTINVLAESKEEVTLTTANDYEGVYDTIKDFLKGYNELINEMDKLYNAESSKGYDPLMSEEKEAMSDKEIEEWEKKIKDSILRRDSTVNDVARALQDVMAGGYEVGGKTYYLSSFGINTLGYFTAADNEKHAYHIDGDKDDEATAGQEDVLRAMISSDPDTVTSFFQKLSNSLYETLTKKMGTTSMSSIYKAYNDKQMKSEYDDYTSKIKAQESKIKAYEDRWYKKFGAMETALAKLNSKQSALSGLLG